MERYHVLEVIGEGSFGRVYKGRRRCSAQVRSEMGTGRDICKEPGSIFLEVSFCQPQGCCSVYFYVNEARAPQFQLVCHVYQPPCHPGGFS